MIMPQLMNQTKKLTICNQVETADHLWQRMRGLLGRASLPSSTVMLIPKCNSIHTWFMKFAIDVVFVDKNLKVVRIEKSVPPWNLVLPVWKASAVFEFAAGTIRDSNLSTGDQLYVGD